jgi:hypothetical protein
VLFFQNMAHHLSGLKRGFLQDLANVLLTHDAREGPPSLVKQLPQPAFDTGLRKQVEVLDLAAGAKPWCSTPGSGSSLSWTRACALRAAERTCDQG